MSNKVEHQAYPSNRYHVDGRVKKVISKEHEESLDLGDDWQDSPFPPKAPVVADVPKNTDEVIAELKSAIDTLVQNGEKYAQKIEETQNAITDIDIRLESILKNKWTNSADSSQAE